MTPIRRHWSRVASLGCLICGGPATLHHPHGPSITERVGLKGGSLKHSDWLVIPLCAYHHTGDEGVDGFLGVGEWEARFGTQADMVDRLGERLGLNLWDVAEQEAISERLSRKYKKPSKVLERS